MEQEAFIDFANRYSYSSKHEYRISSHVFCACVFAFVMFSCLISTAKSIYSPAKLSVLPNTESKISCSDWPALDIDFPNTISPWRGKQEAVLELPLVSDMCS